MLKFTLEDNNGFILNSNHLNTQNLVVTPHWGNQFYGSNLVIVHFILLHSGWTERTY